MAHHDKGLSAQAVEGMLARRAAEAAAQPSDPRQVTTGVISRHEAPKAQGRRSRARSTDPRMADWLNRHFLFDWYQATIAAPDGRGQCEVGGPVERDALNRAYAWAEAEGLHLDRGTHGRLGYRLAVPLLDGIEGDRLGAVLSGSQGQAMPQVLLTGAGGRCAAIAPQFRAAFSGHRVSRLDLAADFVAEGLWDRLHQIALAFTPRAEDVMPDPQNDPPSPSKKRKRRTKIGVLGALTYDGNEEKGRTFYLGSRDSDTFLRVYEKGKQRINDPKNPDPSADPSWVRIEAVFKGGKRSVALGYETVDRILCSSPMLRRYLKAVADMMEGEDMGDVGKVALPLDPGRSSTLEEKVEHGVRQSGRNLVRLAAARIVEREFGGNWSEAAIDPLALADEVAEIYVSRLTQQGILGRVMDDLRILDAEAPNDRAEAYAKRSQAVARNDLRLRRDAARQAEGAGRGRVSPGFLEGTAEHRQRIEDQLAREQALAVS